MTNSNNALKSKIPNGVAGVVKGAPHNPKVSNGDLVSLKQPNAGAKATRKKSDRA